MRKGIITSVLCFLAIVSCFTLAEAKEYETMFVRGTFNGWGGKDQMKKVGPNQWEAVVQVKKGRHKFKFEVSGGNSWKDNFGKGKKGIKIAKKGAKGMAALDAGFNDIKTKFKKTGKYKFTFNDKTKEFTVEPAK